MNNNIYILIKIILFLSINKLFSQDQMIYKNGNELAVKVIRINSNSIVYKKFSNINGPEYTEQKSNIFMIKYKNGGKDIFSENEISKKPTTTVGTNKNEECSADSLVFRNNKFVIICKDNNKILRYATAQEVKNNKTSSEIPGAKNIYGGCGDKPEEPARFNNPQYKQTKAYKKYKKELIEWKTCTGND